MIQLDTFPVGAFQCNCSILGCPQTKEAIIIDPGDEGARISEMVKKKGYTVKFILHTHAHLDHIGGTCDVKKDLGGTVVLHKDDMFLYDQAEMQGMMMGLQCKEPPPVDHFLEDEEGFEFGSFKIDAIHTPGHTPGSASFLLNLGDEQVLFAGDTLFRRSIGRTDLPGGNFDTIVKSIKRRLFTLDVDTVVIPGHGPASTIGEEKHGNPFVGTHA